MRKRSVNAKLTKSDKCQNQPLLFYITITLRIPNESQCEFIMDHNRSQIVGKHTAGEIISNEMLIENILISAYPKYTFFTKSK